MPRESAKTKIVKNLIENSLEEIKFITDVFSDDEDLVEDTIDELYDDLLIVLTCRRGVENIIPKSIQWCDDILTTMDDNRFRQMLRVDRTQFAHLLSLIENDDVFAKCSGKQLPVDIQLAVVLYRLGSSGESASIRKIASTFGIGDGGTLTKITRRVFKAFLKQLHLYIYWPDPTERSEIVRETFNELPFCVGYVDGNEIKLAEAPIKNPKAFFSRNHVYAIKAQMVCDYKRKLRDVVVGYSGSTHDAKIFKNCSLYKHQPRFFSGQEWVARDSAYPLSNIIITPYRSNSQQFEPAKRKQFNKQHSRYRVRIEHCFGILKERFCSLKELRIRIQNESSQKYCNEWILVCCILHNILIDSSESDDLKDSSPEDINEEEVEETTSNNFELKRQSLYHLMFPNSV